MKISPVSYKIFVAFLCVIWPKTAVFGCFGQKLFNFFRSKKCYFFQGVYSTNTLKTAFRFQPRGIISPQYESTWFCKNFLYDVTKLAPTRAFLQKCMEKNPKKLGLIFDAKHVFEPLGGHMGTAPTRRKISPSRSDCVDAARILSTA